MESADNVQKENLQESRKTANKEKKAIKQLEKQIELEYKLRQKKLPPSSTKITIITQLPPQKESRNEISSTENKNVSCIVLNGNNNQNTSERYVTNHKTMSKRQSNVHWDCFFQKREEVRVQNKEKPVKTYVGNLLDSSHPTRSAGKHREVPKEKLPSKLKEDIKKQESHRSSTDVLIDYCDNIVSTELNEAVITFIKKIVRFQENSFKTNAAKAKVKRRYVAGLHETRKHLLAKKVKVLIIATDLRVYNEEDLLYKKVHDLKYLANEHEIPCIFALKRFKIGNLIKKHQAVSCIGILNEQSAEDEFCCILKNLIKLSKDDTVSYENIPDDFLNKPKTEISQCDIKL